MTPYSHRRRGLKLNLGSYIYPIEGYVNVDIKAWPGVDRKADLNRLPWPFPSGSVDEIRAVDIIEHLGNLTKVEIVAELARITKPGALVTIRVPCGTHYLALASLQHAHSFFINSFDENYTQESFSLERRYLTVSDWGRKFFYRPPFRWFWNFLLFHTRLVWTITFELRRKEV
jgi:predicted SAM-dependent methyltransferase